MVEQIFQAIQAWIECFYFVTAIRSYEQGVLLRRSFRVVRNGWRFRLETDSEWKVLDVPGVYFYWPLGIEACLSDHVVEQPLTLAAQSLTTRDNKSRVVASACVYRIDDIQKALLECEDRAHLISNTVAGVIAKHIAEGTEAEVTGEALWKNITIESRRKCKRYGVHIQSVEYRDNAACRAIRLMQG